MEHRWQVTHLKFIIFYPPTDQVDAGQLWLQAMQELAPEYRRAGAQTHASGVSGAFRCDLIAVPGRAELVVTPAPKPEVPGQEYLEDLEEAFGNGLSSALRWEDVKINRAAIFLEAHRAMETHQEAVAETLSELRLSLPDDVKDLNLQVNRRKRLDQSDGQMNRLCTWGVQTLQTISVVIGPSATAQQTVDHETVVRSLRLDINTVPQEQPLEELASTWLELANETRTLLSSGYEHLLS